MSIKRQATTVLNHDNWDQEDETDNTDGSEGFKIAAKDVLEKRVIKVAKRRSQNPDGEGKKSVFSGFTGFNKSQKSSFDFLSNLTNGNKMNTTSDSMSSTIQSPSAFTLTGTNIASPVPNLGTSSESTVFGKPFAMPSTSKTPNLEKTNESTVFGSPFSLAGTSPTSSVGNSSKPVFATNLNSGQSVFSSMKSDTPSKDDNDTKTEMYQTPNTSFPLKPSLHSSPFAKSPTQSSIFGGNVVDPKNKTLATVSNTDTPFKTPSPANSPVQPSIFGANVVDSKNKTLLTVSNNETPFKTQSPASTPAQSSIFGGNVVDSKSKTLLTVSNSETPFKTQSPASTPAQPSIFGGNMVDSKNKTLPTVSNTETPFKTQSPASTPESSITKISEHVPNDENTLNYYRKLKGLNMCVSDWIKEHVDKTPLCILTPIFKDYDNHLKDIQKEYEKGKENAKIASALPENTKLNTSNSTNTPLLGLNTSPTTNSTNNSLLGTNVSPTTTSANTPLLGVNASPTTNSINTPLLGTSAGLKKPTNTSLLGSNAGSTMFADTPTSKSLFTLNAQDKNTNSNFSFGVNASSTATTSSAAFTIPNTGFTFGIKSSPLGSTSTPTTNGSNGNTPFSFGIGKPFSFNSNIKQHDEPPVSQDDANEDDPPKVEYNPVVEENSVYDKKCKIFVKKDGNFIDKGVGTLYVKKIEESGKHQLLVRANTNLGNVLLNLILSSSLPTQRMGKNNVMMVCIPTPEAKPPPVPILIRVKTTEEADDLLSTLEKYKA